MKGIRIFDIDLDYEGMRTNHFPGGLIEQAGMSTINLIGGGSRALYNKRIIYAIHCANPIILTIKSMGSHQGMELVRPLNMHTRMTLAQMAKVLGKKGDYNSFMKRSE